MFVLKKHREEYYRSASSYMRLHSIPVPLLCINAADDPFAPLDTLDLQKIVDANPNVSFAVTNHGAHLMFLQRAPDTWIRADPVKFSDKAGAEFLHAALGISMPSRVNIEPAY